jgi:hypothetical protein
MVGRKSKFFVLATDLVCTLQYFYKNSTDHTSYTHVIFKHNSNNSKRNSIGNIYLMDCIGIEKVEGFFYKKWLQEGDSI